MSISCRQTSGRDDHAGTSSLRRSSQICHSWTRNGVGSMAWMGGCSRLLDPALRHWCRWEEASAGPGHCDGHFPVSCRTGLLKRLLASDSDIGIATSDQVHELVSRLLPTTLGVEVSRRVPPSGLA